MLAFGVFSVAGCEKKKTSADIAIWSAPNTQKILRSHEYTQRGEGIYKVSVFREETEAGQLIFTPSADVSSFTFEIRDLKSDTGAVLPKACFEVFHQKYIEVKQSTYTLNSELGWYPDALLPVEAAVRAGENRIAAGDNQGLWIEVTPPDGLPADIYRGTFTLTADGVVYDIPAEVTVYDFTLPEESHTKSFFNVDQYWTYGAMVAGELDSSIEMYDAYVQALMKYRLNVGLLPGGKDMDGYVTRLIEYYKNPRFTNFGLPLTYAYDADIEGTGIDTAELERVLTALADASVANDFNLLKAACVYNVQIDEAVIRGNEVMAEKWLWKMNAFLDDLADRTAARLSGKDAALVQEIADSIRYLPLLLVDEYSDKITAPCQYVPKINQYNTETSRAKYAHNEEKWWYTCNVPRNPYPTYHLDDVLISSRILSWMQYDYDVTGNLYWSTTIYGDHITQKPTGNFYEDAMRLYGADGTNGEGFLFYPGKPYGIYGPVASIRLASIRDGLEEFELLYALEALYGDAAEKYGYEMNFDAVADRLFDRLYYGTIVNTSTAVFAGVREDLAGLLIAAATENVFVADIRSDKDGFVAEVLVPDDVTAEIDLEQIGERKVRGARVITLKIPGTEDALTVRTPKHAVELRLGGRRTLYTAEDYNGFRPIDGQQITLTDAEELGYAGKLIYVENQPVSGYQRVVCNADILSSVDENVRYLYIDVYSESREDVAVQMYITGTKTAVQQSVGSGILHNGWNRLTVPLLSVTWNRLGAVSSLELSFGEERDRTAHNVYLGDMVAAAQLPTDAEVE